MDKGASSGISVAVIGGDGRHLTIRGVALHRFESAGDGGIGRQRSMVAAIRGGRFALVVVVVRWLGHGDSERARQACRRNGVPCRVVAGGMTSVARVVRAFVDGGRDVE